MDLKAVIKDLISLMDKGGLSKLHVREKNGFEVSLEKKAEGSCHAPAPHAKGQFHHAPAQEFLPAATETKHTHQEDTGHFVKSPMVGTFYASASPTDAPFVKVGDRVEKGSVMCIVEAMKVMNEVKSDKAGVVKEVLMENMQPVEFGTKLFKIE